MSEVNKIANYNQMMSWLTRPSVPKTETREDFAIGGGVIQGNNLGSREGFAGPQLIKSGVNKNKYTYGIRNPEWRPGKGQSPTIKQGPFDTLEEAQESYDTRQKKMGELKSSGQKTKILNQTKEINNFVNNFFDNNIDKFSVKDYDKFEKTLIKEYKKANISSLGEKGRNIFRHGLPNIGAKGSELSFDKYNVGNFFSQGKDAEKAYKNYFKKLFFSGKIETDLNLKQGINKFLNYEILDKRKVTFNPPENIDEVLYLVADDETGTGKFRSGIIKKYFPDTMDKYIKKKNRSSALYNEKLALIESKFKPEELEKILGGETSIKRFMNKQSNLLKEIYDVSTLPPGLNFNLDHTEGIAEIAKMKNKKDIARGLNNLIGMTSSRNYQLGWKGYSTKRKSLLNNISQGIDVDKNLQELNDLTKVVYPEVKNKDAYKIVNNKITTTKDFNFTYEPEKAFRQYFTELTTSPQSLKVLQSQYEKNPNFKEFIQKDPNLTSAIDNTYNKMIEVLKNPKFKNVLQNSGLTLRGLGQMRKGNIPGFLNTMEKLIQKNPDFKVELGDPYKDIENQLASASMMSDVNPIERKEKPKEGTTEGGSVAAAGGATLLGRYAKPLLKGALKTVGSLPAAGTFAYMDIKQGMNEGQSFIDAATDPTVGLELLLPETVKKLGPLMARAARLSTPVGTGITVGGTLKNRAKEMMKQAEGITSLDEGEEQRKLIEEYAAKNYKGYNQGGRVNFADGPEDPKKRNFMKIMGGLASIPLLGRFIDIGTQAPKVAEVVKRSADGVPEFLMDLIAKVKLKAKTKGMEYFTGNKPEEFKDVYQVDNYVVTEKGNKTIIREIDQDGDMLYKENQMELDYDPETGGYTYNEASARPDAEGKLKDVEEYIEDDDLENMRKYTYDE